MASYRHLPPATYRPTDLGLFCVDPPAMAFRPGLLYALLRIVVWLVVGAAAAKGQAQSGIVSPCVRC